MKKRLIALLTAATILFPNSANAVMGGESAKGDERIVVVYAFTGKHKYVPCSGYLYAPRIVITAAHCLFKPEDRFSRWPDKNISVGKPGVVVDTWAWGSHIQAEKIFWYEDYDQIRPKGRYNNKDFAIIVLKKPAANVGWAKMMSKDEFFSLRDQEGLVTVGGYGFSSYKERSMQFNHYKYPRKVTLPFANKPFWEEAKKCRVDCHFFGENLENFDDAGWVVTSKETGTTCDGDSGAGFYIEGEQDIYVGLNAWPMGGPNCEKNGTWSKYGSMNRIDPIFYHEDLLKKAVRYTNKLKSKK